MNKIRKQRQRHSSKNPPENVHSATMFVEVLEKDEEHILAAIETRIIDDFERDDDYYDWLRRAERALALTRTERRFLIQWVQERVPKFRPYEESREKLLEELQRYAQQLADEVKELCKAVYAANRLPPEVAAAETRLTELLVIHTQLDERFANLRVEWARHALEQSLQKRVRAPLQHLLGMIAAEEKILRQFISRGKIQEPGASDQPRAEVMMQAPSVTRRRPEDYFTSIIDPLRVRATDLASEIRREYCPMYSRECQPTTPDEAEARWVVILDVKLRAQKAFSEISEGCRAHAVPARFWKAAKAPVQGVLDEAEAELKVLRPYLLEDREDQRRFLFRIIERAVAAGFQLTQKEKNRFDRIASFLHHRSS